jgi:phospholipid transport system substrate-binding protein
MGRTMPAEGMVAVDTTVTRPNQAPADVRWVVDEVAGQPKIVDVLAEGTSLRLTQRSDYASYLSRNGNDVQALIDAIRRQLGA